MIIAFLNLILASSRDIVGTYVNYINWTRFKSINCYSGWGAKELDGGHDCGIMNLAACKAKCKELYNCKSVTWNTKTGHCFRRGYVSCTYTRIYSSCIDTIVLMNN